MAAEIFTVGKRNFQLPGLGAYLRAAADAGDMRSLVIGIFMLVLVIVLLDQMIWRPLLAWSDRFKVDTVGSDNPPRSWFYDFWQRSVLIDWLGRHLWGPAGRSLDVFFNKRLSGPIQDGRLPAKRTWVSTVLLMAAGALVFYLAGNAIVMLAGLPLVEWGRIGLGVLATFLRVAIALVIALLWTVPVGVAVGTNTRLATVLQPVIQILASVPATALFPAFLLFFLSLPNGLNLAAVLLMLMGTQWYVLFNVTAGAVSIPQDLKYTSAMLRLNTRSRWRTLILPAMFPYIVTGAITASGGAWNASIVAEYVTFGGKTYFVTGIGSLIARATASGNYPLLLASTMAMILTVVLINRLVWRRLYLLAEEQYRME
jgi:NitT/TauT family transport system permease protein